MFITATYLATTKKVKSVDCGLYRATTNAYTRNFYRNLSVRPSVCLSVKHMHCGKTKETSAHIFIPYERRIESS